MYKQNNKKSESLYLRNKNTRDFLLSFFQPESGYETKEINGFMLIKQFSNYIWSVAIYTKQAYLKRTENRRMFSSTYRNKTRGNSVSEDK